MITAFVEKGINALGIKSLPKALNVGYRKRIIEMGYYDYTNKISELLNDARYELSEKEFMNLIDDIIYMAEEWKG